MQFDPALPVAVFLGPSLPRAEAATILAANYYPPVKHGDVYRLITSGVRMIVIIDGVFHSITPVWQREIVAALRHGIAVVGSTSMGALRAVEVAAYGMVGHGQIYEWYRDGVLDGDDEVALLHSDGDWGYIPLSEPLVNIRHNLRIACDRGILSPRERDDLIDVAKQTPFVHRSFAGLLASTFCQSWPASAQARLQAFFRDDTVDLKRQDAIASLEYCNSLQLQTASAQVVLTQESFRGDPESSSRTAGFLHVESFQRGVLNVESQLVPAQRLVETAMKEPEFAAATWKESSSSFFLGRWMNECGVSAPHEYQQRFLASWIATHAFPDLVGWLRANGLVESEFRNEMLQRASVDWFCHQPPPEPTFANYRRCLAALSRWRKCQFQSAGGTADPREADNDRESLQTAVAGFQIAAWAAANGVGCPAAVAEDFINEWEEGNDILSRGDWLDAVGLDESTYLQVWSQRALFHWVVERGPNFFGFEAWSFPFAVLRELQVTGQLTEFAKAAKEPVP